VRRRPDGNCSWYRHGGTLIAPTARLHVADHDEIDTVAQQRIDALARQRENDAAEVDYRI
jgi:hypothetical protein